MNYRNTNIGTPKTLREAIYNAHKESYYSSETGQKLFRDHILDFLSQKFTKYMLKHEDSKVLQDLWEDIKGEAQGDRHE